MATTFNTHQVKVRFIKDCLNTALRILEEMPDDDITQQELTTAAHQAQQAATELTFLRGLHYAKESNE